MPNRLRAARRDRGWSQAGLYNRLRDTAAETGDHLPGWVSMRQLISRWENDRAHPDPYYQRLLCAVFSCDPATLGLGDEPGDEAFGLAVEASHAAAVKTATTQWGWDVDRREFLIASGFAATSVVAPVPPSASGPVIGRRTGTIGVGASDVAVLRDLTAAYRRADNRNGGGAVRDRLVRALHHEVGPLLKRGRYDEATGRDLTTVAAEMTQLAGWMAYDCGLHGLSQRYLIQSLSLARSIDDWSLSGEVLAALAHQAAYLGHSAQAVEYATAAADLGRRAGQRNLIAEAAVLEAQGHAGLGSSSAAARALHRAELDLDRADRDNGPAYLAYLDEAYLSAKFGWVFRELGDGPGTVRFAERSLDMQPGYERGRVFNLALLAHGHARCGQVDESVNAAADALRLSSDMKSSRAVGYLRDVAILLKPHTKRPDVAAVRKRIRYLKPTW